MGHLSRLSLNFIGVAGDENAARLQPDEFWFNGGLHFDGRLGGTFSAYDTERQAIEGTASGDTTASPGQVFSVGLRLKGP